MRVRLLGTGDAFGSGGRFQACTVAEAEGQRLLLDCGATSSTALKAAGVGRGEIDAILVSHFHGDHFGGVPFVILDEHVAGRTRPLTIAGPVGVAERVRVLFDALYPGLFSGVQLGFAVEFVTLSPGQQIDLGAFSILPFSVEHEAASHPLGVRVSAAGRTLAYSGDSAWTPALGDLARGSDLFLCDCLSLEREIPGHLTLRIVAAHRAELECRRLVLTHLGPEMQARGSDPALAAVGAELARDGMVFDL